MRGGRETSGQRWAVAGGVESPSPSIPVKSKRLPLGIPTGGVTLVGNWTGMAARSVIPILVACLGIAITCTAQPDLGDTRACPPLNCPAGAINEGEPCGRDTNGGCNSNPPAFTRAECGDTVCGTLWIEDSVWDTDWFLIDHGGGIVSAELVSQSPGLCYILDGIDGCTPFPVGDIGCSDDGVNQTVAGNIDLPAGEYAVLVRLPHCNFDGIPPDVLCGTGCNDYRVEISCTTAVTGACCLPDKTCVDGLMQSECEDPPNNADCGDCNQPDPNGEPGCSDQTCQDIVCAADPFCCDIGWDGICANEADDLCECGGVGGLGGEYQGDDSICDGPICIPLGGCCQCDGADQFCTVETAERCAALNGLYLGDNESCEAGRQVTFSSNPNLAIPFGDPVGVFDSIIVG